MNSVDMRLRLLQDYEEKLATGVALAYDYCERLALAIPGPFVISRATFANDALIHALFGSAEDITTTLASSRPLREYLEAHPASPDEPVFALLRMRLRLNKRFGTRMVGEILKQDEVQTALDFSDHQLSEPAPDLDALHRRLTERFYAGLLEEMAEEIEQQRQELFALREHLALEKALHRAAGTSCISARCADLQTRIETMERAFMPDAVLDRLSGFLKTVEARLKLAPARFRIDRLGILAPAEDQEIQADTIRFVELVSHDRRRWVLMCVRFERREAHEALAAIEARRRAVMI
ncbi:MAG: hypothetical protein ACK4E4_04395 [Rhodocyclaceae bacterium]